VISPAARNPKASALPMDVNLRKTATDTAYIVVGVGVLGPKVV
jgi:hypothetical protein